MSTTTARTALAWLRTLCPPSTGHTCPRTISSVLLGPIPGSAILSLMLLAALPAASLAAVPAQPGAVSGNTSTAPAPTSSPFSVIRTDHSVTLQGIRCWSPSEKQSSVHAAQQVVAQAFGEKIDYDYLLGISSLAFRMQISPEGFCPSSPHPACGFKCTSRSLEILPCVPEVFPIDINDPASITRARTAVIASIDKGIPAEFSREETGIILGYTDAEWICCHPFHDAGATTYTEMQQPWSVTTYSPRKTPMPPRRDLILRSAAQAIVMYEAEQRDKYYVGFRAWQEYLRRLQELDDADTRTLQASMQGNAWIYECLANYRAAAARYLRSVSSEFPPKNIAHANQAAALYDQIANRILRDPKHTTTDIAPYPHTLKPGQTWDKPTRDEQIKRLRQALSIEQRALFELRLSLAGLE